MYTYNMYDTTLRKQNIEEEIANTAGDAQLHIIQSLSSSLTEYARQNMRQQTLSLYLKVSRYTTYGNTLLKTSSCLTQAVKDFVVVYNLSFFYILSLNLILR